MATAKQEYHHNYSEEKCCKKCEEKCHEDLCIEKLSYGFIVKYKCKEYAFEELCKVIDFVKEVYEKEH